MEVTRDADGDLRLSRLAPLHADTLLRIPDLLRSDDRRVRDRLLPPAYEEGDDQAHWRRNAAPELERLFASRAELIRKDLASLAAAEGPAFSMRIRQTHASAWLAGLNAARLALYALHDLTPADMERAPEALGDFDKEVALVRIHIMAFLQEMLIDAGV